MEAGGEGPYPPAAGTEKKKAKPKAPSSKPGTGPKVAAEAAAVATGLGTIKHPGRARGKGATPSTFGSALKCLRGVSKSVAPGRPAVAGQSSKAGPQAAAMANVPGDAEPAEDIFSGTFAKELPLMMYGFGDDGIPLNETVAVVEGALLQYLSAIATRATDVAADSMRNKPDERDILFVVRKDPVKFARAKELLHMNEYIKKMREVPVEKATAAALQSLE